MALIERELRKYKIYIAGLCETRFVDEGQVAE